MLILGCGYLGQALSRHYSALGIPVTGVARSAKTASAIEATGARALRLDLAEDDLSALAPEGEQIFHLAPPPSETEGDPLTRHLIEAFGRYGHPQRLVYASTTGVYGDCGGEWVDETRAPRPLAGRAKRRWDAEQCLRAWSADSNAELVILRVAGIYACDRLPLERIHSGQPVVKADEAPWSNRIHAVDLLNVCVAAMERAPTGSVYNVCDGHPSTMSDYFLRVADAAGLQRPPELPLAEADGKVSAGMLSYLRESRRLSNRQMIDELGVKLSYPSLEEGLRDCFPRDRD
jgi:nucleoside-diphosphate-sugar epimerase